VNNYGYPLTGGLRESILTIDWIIIFLCLELSLMLLVRYKNTPKETRRIQDVGYTILFLAYMLMWIGLIFADFYAADLLTRRLFLTFGYLSLVTGVFIFVLIIEKSFNIWKENIFSILFLVILVLAGINIFVEFDLKLVISITFWPLLAVFLIFYLKGLMGRGYNPHFKGFVVLLIISMVSLFFGFILGSEMILDILGPLSKLIADIFHLASVILLFLFFINLPPFSEFDWRDKIESLFIMDSSGLCLYNKFFKINSENINENLITGSLTTIKLLLEKITYQRSISVFRKKGGSTTIIYPGKYITGVLFCDEDLMSLKVKLFKLVNKIESLYWTIFSNWNGNMEVFTPIKNISARIFLY